MVAGQEGKKHLGGTTPPVEQAKADGAKKGGDEGATSGRRGGGGGMRLPTRATRTVVAARSAGLVTTECEPEVLSAGAGSTGLRAGSSWLHNMPLTRAEKCVVS